MGKHLSAVIGRIIFIGFSIQIVLGILWMGRALFGVQDFGVSLPAGVRVPLYLLQYAAAFFAGYKLLGSMLKDGLRIFGALALVTFPMAMQCHMSLLPYSLVSSCLLFELGFVIDSIRGRGYTPLVNYVFAGIFWAIASMLLPEYAYIGAFPAFAGLIACAVHFWEKHKKGLLSLLLVTAALVGCVCAGSALTAQMKGPSGVRGGLSYDVMKRTAAYHMGDMYHYWPDELKAVMDNEAIEACVADPEAVDRVLAPALESAVSPERAKEIYDWLGLAAWQVYNDDVIREIALDSAAYLCAPAAFLLQMADRAYASYTPGNYEIMRRSAPVLTKYYMYYSVSFCAIALVLSVLLALLLLVSGDSKGKRGSFLVCAGVCVLTGVLAAARCILAAGGTMDYKKGIAVTLLWLVWIVGLSGLAIMRGRDGAKEE